jgi:hypothetical protein
LKIYSVSRHCSGGDIFSRTVARKLSSALKRFTSEFGMVSGGATLLKPPEHCLESKELFCFVEKEGRVPHVWDHKYQSIRISNLKPLRVFQC